MRRLPVNVPGYYVAGPSEFVNMNLYAQGWEKMDYVDHNWPKARTLFNGLTKDAAIDSRGWMLVPSPLPQMEMTPQRLAKVVKATGVAVDPAFPAAKKQVTIPAGTKATLWLDQSVLTNAYPHLFLVKVIRPVFPLHTPKPSMSQQRKIKILPLPQREIVTKRKAKFLLVKQIV
jgi:hypothetical protein